MTWRYLPLLLLLLCLLCVPLLCLLCVPLLCLLLLLCLLCVLLLCLLCLLLLEKEGLVALVQCVHQVGAVSTAVVGAPGLHRSLPTLQGYPNDVQGVPLLQIQDGSWAAAAGRLGTEGLQLLEDTLQCAVHSPHATCQLYMG